MSELAGSLGDGRVLVLQPATPTGAGLDIALGIQRFWQKTLKNAGRPAATIMALMRVEAIEGVVPDGLPMAVGDKSVALFKDWADEAAVAGLVLQRESRWGLAATFDASPHAATLTTVLLEAKSHEPPHVIARWAFDAGYAELPEHVCAVLVDVARRLGTKLPWTHASAAFDTDQPAARMLTLEQMGVLSMAEDGCRLKIDGVLERLGALVELAPRARPVVVLVPELLGHLARLGAHDIQLASWLRRVRTAVGVLPKEWDGMLDTISRSRA